MTLSTRNIFKKFYLHFMTCQDYFTHFEPSQMQGGAKWEILEKNHLQVELRLACLTCDRSWARTHSGEMTSDLEC